MDAFQLCDLARQDGFRDRVVKHKDHRQRARRLVELGELGANARHMDLRANAQLLGTTRRELGSQFNWHSHPNLVRAVFHESEDRLAGCNHRSLIDEAFRDSPSVGCSHRAFLQVDLQPGQLGVELIDNCPLRTDLLGARSGEQLLQVRFSRFHTGLRGHDCKSELVIFFLRDGALLAQLFSTV